MIRIWDLCTCCCGTDKKQPPVRSQSYEKESSRVSPIADIIELEDVRKSIHKILDVDDISEKITYKINCIKESGNMHEDLEKLKKELCNVIQTLSQRISDELTEMNHRISNDIIRHISETQKNKQSLDVEICKLREENSKLHFDIGMILTGNTNKPCQTNV